MSSVSDGPVCFHPHLLHIVIQSHDGQRCRETGSCRYGGSHGWCLTDVAMVTGLQEIGCLVVFIQNFYLKVGESWQWVAVVLLCLKGRKIIAHFGCNALPSVLTRHHSAGEALFNDIASHNKYVRRYNKYFLKRVDFIKRKTAHESWSQPQSSSKSQFGLDLFL